jgi:AAA+ ATPase superfamily predicted ATPase
VTVARRVAREPRQAWRKYELVVEMKEFIFHREEESQSLKERLLKRKSFLLYGPGGAGKTLLVRNVLETMPPVLYCESAASPQIVFRSLAQALLRRRDPRVQRACRDGNGIQAKSAVSLKGIVMDSLRDSSYLIVLDHIDQPSQSFAAAVREIVSWCSTPVVAIARSHHMEDTGFLQPLYSDRHARYELKNFDSATAQKFAEEIVQRAGLRASNINEFIGKVLDLTEGNPGAIVAMLQMAAYPRYRSDEHIKITPLYVDFRMNGLTADPRRERA